MSQEITHGPIQRVRNLEYCTASDGTQLKRSVRPGNPSTQWEPLSPQLEPETPPQLLMLVLERQSDGEPFHWYLFVAAEGQPGSVYQVTGDATFMRYVFEQDVQLFSSASYHSSYVLAQLEDGDEAIVERCVRREEPPRAESRTLVTENCQGWTIRVLRRLRDAGIVGDRWVTFAEGIKEPV